jgi:hypothetical protein
VLSDFSLLLLMLIGCIITDPFCRTRKVLFSFLWLVSLSKDISIKRLVFWVLCIQNLAVLSNKKIAEVLSSYRELVVKKRGSITKMILLD